MRRVTLFIIVVMLSAPLSAEVLYSVVNTSLIATDVTTGTMARVMGVSFSDFEVVASTIDPVGRRIFVALMPVFGQPTPLVVIDLATQTETRFTVPGRIVSLAWDPLTARLYASDSDQLVKRIDPANGTTTSLGFAGGGQGGGIDPATQRLFFKTDDPVLGGPAIRTFSYATNSVVSTKKVSNGYYPFFVTYDPSTTLLAAPALGIQFLDPTTGNVVPIDAYPTPAIHIGGSYDPVTRRFFLSGTSVGDQPSRVTIFIYSMATNSYTAFKYDGNPPAFLLYAPNDTVPSNVPAAGPLALALIAIVIAFAAMRALRA